MVGDEAVECERESAFPKQKVGSVGVVGTDSPSSRFSSWFSAT
jgi:hypothetical protein